MVLAGLHVGGGLAVGRPHVLLHKLFACLPTSALLCFGRPLPLLPQMEDILFPILDKYTSTDGQDIFEEVSTALPQLPLG